MLRARILRVFNLLFIGGVLLFISIKPVSAQQDLVVRILQCPKSANAGQDLGAAFQVVAQNSGKAAVKDITIDIVLRNDPFCPSPTPYAAYSPNYSNGVLLKGGREKISLNSGQKLNVKMNGTNTIPLDTPAGHHSLCAMIDAGNKVAESNEQNNCACCPLMILTGAKPEISRYGEQCGKKGSNITILGKNFGTSASHKGVALGGHDIHIDLHIISWSNTKIVAWMPNVNKIQKGQWYYIGVEKADHTEWLSNINKNITICK